MFWNWNTRKLPAAERNILNGNYSAVNKELIVKFENTLFAEGLSKARILKYLNKLNVISGMITVDYPEVTKDDIMKFVAEIKLLRRVNHI